MSAPLTLYLRECLGEGSTDGRYPQFVPTRAKLIEAVALLEELEEALEGLLKWQRRNGLDSGKAIAARAESALTRAKADNPWVKSEQMTYGATPATRPIPKVEKWTHG